MFTVVQVAIVKMRWDDGTNNDKIILDYAVGDDFRLLRGTVAGQFNRGEWR